MFRCSVIVVLLTFGFVSIPQVDGTFHSHNQTNIYPIRLLFPSKISCVGGTDYEQLQQLLNSPEVKQILNSLNPSLYILEKFERFYSLLFHQDQEGE